MIKRSLKAVRGFYPVNWLVRVTVKAITHRVAILERIMSKHWPVTGTVEAKLPGGETIRLSARGSEYLPKKLYWKGYRGYEGPSVHLFYHLAKVADTILDIGAHVGYLTVVAGVSNRDASVTAFEPVKRIRSRLLENLRINDLNHIQVEPFAVSDTDGQVILRVPSGHDLPFASSITGNWVNEVDEVQVETITIDSYKVRQGLPRIDLLKVDCELHELQVLHGMKSVLTQDRPLLLMEILFPDDDETGTVQENHAQGIAEFLKELGYHFYLVNQTALVRMDWPEYNPDDRNYLCSPMRSTRRYLPFNDMDELIRELART